MRCLAFDVGSNSVGSAWIDDSHGQLLVGTSIFPAGVDESDDKRGDPKNAKRRMTRRARITLARRSERKRLLRLRLIAAGLLPVSQELFVDLLQSTNPWELRAQALDQAITAHEFGRILLHLAQRRGALGLRAASDNEDDEKSEDGKVRKAIGEVRLEMIQRGSRTFGEFINSIRSARVTTISSPDRRPLADRTGPREYRSAIRNRAEAYEHCADRAMIRHEFAMLWDKQKSLGSDLASLLTDALRLELDDESGDSSWRHKGLLFGQRRQTWDLGTLGRCVLEPTERCVPHADMYASRFLIVEMVNNLRVTGRGEAPRSLTPEERQKLLDYLSGPLETAKPRATKKGKSPPRPKTTVTVTDLRNVLGWGRATSASPFHLNIERDEDRTINTDWFSREIVHGAISPEKWLSLSAHVRNGINHAVLRFDPDDESHPAAFKSGLLKWGGLNDRDADAVIAAWLRRPKLDAKRLTMSRKAVRNLLAFMDRPGPWPDDSAPATYRWLTSNEARKMISESPTFLDQITGAPLDAHARRRYATAARGASAKDRHYMKKHLLLRDGVPIIGDDGKRLSEPPPAPLVSNPVVRKAIHEVRRHLVEYMTRFGCKPDHIHIELSREARMGAKDADRLLFRNRLRNRIRRNIVDECGLESCSPTQQRAAVVRVILATQQRGVCPLCGNTLVTTTLTPRLAAAGTDCEVAHIVPRGSGGHNGLGNVVLAHTKCNRDMARRTPREYWNAAVPGGCDAGLAWVERIFGSIDRPKAAEAKNASGEALWLCYFSHRDDRAKLDQFKKAVKDIQGMTQAQDAATKYAARQLMTYLADAVFGGTGLPERGGTRRIFATDGIWTSRLRREWGLFFDSHGARSHETDEAERSHRREKDRGDHRHHAIDAIVIGFCTPRVQQLWDDRERRAERDIPNSADEAAMDAYRRLHPLPPPPPFTSADAFRSAVRSAVFGANGDGKPVCHRPVKRKLVGALHEETLRGPVVDDRGELTGLFTSRKAASELKPNHLRPPRPESEKEAIARLTAKRVHEKAVSSKDARRWAKEVVASPGFKPRLVDPLPEKSGIVRDVGLRKTIRRCLESQGIDPDRFTKAEMKRLVDAGNLRFSSGVPIRSAILLQTMNDPVVIKRRKQDYASGNFLYDTHPSSQRAYLGGNNHHIEIREAKDGTLKGVVVTAFEASRRKLAKLQAFRAAGIPKPADFKRLSRADRGKLRPILQQIESDYPIVDRRRDDAKGGRFVMSLAEGEMIYVCEKSGDGEIRQPGYFVVAKLEKPQSVVLVPHWDARAATGRKDSSGHNVPFSERDQFTITPNDLRTLAPNDEALAFKVRVSPLGKIQRLRHD